MARRLELHPACHPKRIINHAGRSKRRIVSIGGRTVPIILVVLGGAVPGEVVPDSTGIARLQALLIVAAAPGEGMPGVTARLGPRDRAK